ncbi:MAG TPA: ribonuclease P protein component [Dokdonella sp.]|uniref:ribonuclease P protein component n=1 Tax=Dokdonella sp. TaxID=2291710 RepID=UPI002D7F6AA2|nr:ribonuclease P protein component [Dokdonella sp.]HET9031423.1 ribonuclease P protein component [Dokdonella sp.]
MGQFAYPRTARLLKPGDFAALRGSSKRIGVRHFLAEYSSNKQPTSRLGQAVSRRVSKRAVDRNRIKRLVRESYRHVLADLPCVDILLIARSSAVKTPSADLRADLASLWKKLATLKAAQGTGTMRG